MALNRKIIKQKEEEVKQRLENASHPASKKIARIYRCASTKQKVSKHSVKDCSTKHRYKTRAASNV